VRSRLLIAAGVAALMVAGATVAVGQAASQDVACTITDNVLSCPLPESAPVTVTQTATVTATVTQTVTSSSPPSTPTTSTSAPPPVTTTPTTTSTAPPSTGWPDASNTGVPDGVSLTASGSITVTAANTVIDGKNITGGVLIKAANVTIKNSRIAGSAGGASCVFVQSGSVTIQDSEIVGNCENGIGFDNWKAIRVEVRGTYGDGVKLGSNVTLQDSWIHDLAPASGAHADGGQVQGGISNTVIRHNVIDLGSSARANAALFIAPDLGPNSNGPLTIDGNKLNGGNFVMYCVDGNNGQYLIKNITITNNRFGAKFTYGRSNVNVPITQSGNVIDATGAAYNL
jgi:hypothetical protein